MDRVYRFREKPLTEISHAAVAVGIGNFEFPHQLHTGVFHASQDESPRMLHLAWHSRLQNSSPEDWYLWIHPPFEPERLRQVATMCRRIFRKNQENGLPYGFGVPNDNFDHTTGEYLIRDSHFGLTCASFVLAVFDAVSLKLANYASWPTGRDSDKAWQRWVIEMLEMTGAPERHIQNVKCDIGSVRFHPQQVAACASLEHVPVTFDAAEMQGNRIRRTIFDQHVQMLRAALEIPEGTPSLTDECADATFRLIDRWFGDYMITPYSVSIRQEWLIVAYKHEYLKSAELHVCVESNADMSATIFQGQEKLSTREIPDDEQELMEQFRDMSS